jgi:hypothetical protein
MEAAGESMKFVGQVFDGGEVTLDYNEFVDCEMRGCVLTFYGGEFSLVRTRLEKVQFALGGAANNTLSFLRLVRANGPALLDGLLDAGPQPEPGQGVTIN